MVVIDADKRDCVALLKELNGVAASCNPTPTTLFRLAIEEIEAWYLGDRHALISAYPRARKKNLEGYEQDSRCNTWELMADAVYTGGAAAIKRVGWPLPGQVKHEWARNIGPLMDPSRNISPSFGKLCDGLRRLLGESANK